MQDVEKIVEMIADNGMGMASFIFIILVTGYFTFKIIPFVNVLNDTIKKNSYITTETIKQLKESNERLISYIRDSNKNMNEVVKDNNTQHRQNIITFTDSINKITHLIDLNMRKQREFESKIDKQEEILKQIDIKTTKINEKIKNIDKKGGNNE